VNHKNDSERIILGVDPGTTITGFSLLRITGHTPSIITFGIIDLRKKHDHYQKIKVIFEEILGLIDQYHPDELAIEAPFFGKNVQSMLKLGRAQGAAISAALYRDMPVFEYAPRKIKMSITGMGQASKEQVATMLMRILGFKDDNFVLDATDALGAALCHFYQGDKPVIEKGCKSWKEYMAKNPDKVK